MNYTNKGLLILLISAIFMISGTWGVLRFKGYLRYIIALYLVIIIIALKFIFPNSFYPNLVLFLLTPSFIIGILIFVSQEKQKADPIKDVVFYTTKGKEIVRNIFRGVIIFGATRSGKTASIIYQFIKHFAKNKFAGIIYDYKKGELTELAIPLVEKDKLKIISVSNPNISDRINVIDPIYIKDELSAKSIVKVLLTNLRVDSSKNGDNFFEETASSLLEAIILRLALDFKRYCTLPHVIAFILAVDFSAKKETEEKQRKGLSQETMETFAGLKAFIIENKRIKIQGSPFLMGLGSDKQTAAVISTLANGLTKISFPSAFWVLSKNDFDLDISKDDTRYIVSILNDPKDDDVYDPLIAMIIQMFLRNMSERNRKPSFILLDEAPTIKLNKMAKIPSTMASFGVCTIYCAQDIVQGTVKYGKDAFLEIISNLTTQFFGKSNNKESASFYEAYSGIKKERKKTTSSGKNGGSTSLSYNDVPRVKKEEFLKFKQGEFLTVSDGQAKRVKFKKPVEIREEIKEKRQVSQAELEANYNRIIEEIEVFAKKIGLTQKE